MSTSATARNRIITNLNKKSYGQNDGPRPLTVVTVNRAEQPGLAPVRSSNRPWKLIGGIMALVVLAAVGWSCRSSLSKTLSSSTAAVATSAPLESSRVFALGRIEPRGQVMSVVGPEGAGTARIKQLNVVEGDSVEKDAILAVLDNEQRLIAEKMTAESRLRKAEAVLAQTRRLVQSTQQELLASLEVAKVTQANERRTLDRYLQLRQANATTKSDLDQAQFKFDSAEQTVKEVQAKLTRYQAEPDSEPVDILVALEDLTVAKASLVEAVARMDQAYVRAPVAGTALYIHKRPGEPIGQGAVLDLGATDEMFVRVDVYETDVRHLAVGQQADFKSAAIDGSLSGQVSHISTMVKKQSVVDATPAANTDARVIEVLVRLNDASAEVARKFVGLQVRAEFRP